MLILPAIDLYEKKAVRLHKGDYAQMTVYNDHPLAVAEDFAAAGAQWIHIVDLEGARDGTTPNAAVVTQTVSYTHLDVYKRQLVAHCRLTPRRDRTRTTNGCTAFTTAVGMVTGVHDRAADRRADAHVTLPASLADVNIAVVNIANLTDACLLYTSPADLPAAVHLPSRAPAASAQTQSSQWQRT